MELKIEPMVITDYDEVIRLWRSVDGVGLHDDVDSREGIGKYLDRNPEMSFVARIDGRLVGAVLSGHDGRRGFLHHLAVDSECREQGIGRKLVARCLAALDAAGISKCSIMVFADNAEGKAFWRKIGWFSREDLLLLQRHTDTKAMHISRSICR